MLSIDKYSLTFYGDSASHLIGARKIVDWMDPGLNQLGTVWLPLPHLLLLPFSLVDALFTSGLAGTIVSLPSLAITAALIYKMIRIHIVEGCAYIAFAGALLYASNPNILYIGLTAMTEAPFMLFFVASAYYFQNWRLNSSRFRNLLLCSVFVALATLCRYEGWILAAFLVPFAIVFMAKEKAGNRRKLYGILLSLVCFSGIVLWLGYNAYRYGDPLEFANASYYSASSQALDRSVRETLFLQPANVITVYGITAVMMYGPVLLAGALAGYFYHRHVPGGQIRKVLYIYLSLPPLFTVITLIIGIGEMSYWFNSRFLILLSPLIIMLIAVCLKNLPQIIGKHRVLTMGTVAALFLFQLISPAFAVITYLDAKGGFFYGVNPYAVQTGEELRSLYDGGGITTMTGSAQEHRIML
ncbi:MAG TPA: glycosyltransferase family 39 protein, partial [Nitrososphaera sp.]